MEIIRHTGFQFGEAIVAHLEKSTKSISGVIVATPYNTPKLVGIKLIISTKKAFVYNRKGWKTDCLFLLLGARRHDGELCVIEYYDFILAEDTIDPGSLKAKYYPCPESQPSAQTIHQAAEDVRKRIVVLSKKYGLLEPEKNDG